MLIHFSKLGWKTVPRYRTSTLTPILTFSQQYLDAALAEPASHARASRRLFGLLPRQGVQNRKAVLLLVPVHVRRHDVGVRAPLSLSLSLLLRCAAYSLEVLSVFFFFWFCCRTANSKKVDRYT